MSIMFVKEYPIGARVVMCNLVKSPDLNGRTGTVQSRLKENGRQAILIIVQHQEQQSPPRRQVAIKPANLRFEPRPIESLSETDMTLVLKQKGGGLESMGRDPATTRGLSKSELRAKVSAAFDADTDTGTDAIALQIGQILGLDAAEKATMQEIKAETAETPDHVEVDRFSQHQLKHLEEDPPCLGGVPEKGGLKLPRDSFYTRGLDRSANLGPLKSNGPFESRSAERVFRKLSEGNCSIGWGINTEKDELTILVFENENFQDWRMYINIKQQYNVDIGQYSAVAGGIWLWTELLSHHVQLESLRYRVLHRFFRCYGHLLPTKQQDHVFGLLKEKYTRDEQWKSCLDLSITMADTAFNTGHPDCAKALIRVGEALEAAGRFAKASLIYKEIATLLAQGTLSNESGYVFMSMCHDYAGTALDRCGKTAAAEEEFFLALKADYEQEGSVGSDGLRVWNVKEDWTAQLWHKMLTMHDRFAEAIAASGTREGHIRIDSVDGDEKLRLAWMAMPGLLTVAGFSHHMPSFSQHGAAFSKVALERYKYSPQVATDALARSVDESQSAKDFCRSLIGTLNPRIVAECSIRFGHLGGPGTTAPSGPLSEKSSRENGKREARRFASSSSHGDYVITSCHNPSCPKQREKLRGKEIEAKTKYCQCQGAQYCSRVCQKAHWSIHKKTCPFGKGK